MLVQQKLGTLSLTDSNVSVCVATCWQIAASGNALFLKTEESEEQSLIHLNFSNIEKGEKKPLLQHGNRHWRAAFHYTQANSNLVYRRAACCYICKSRRSNVLSLAWRAFKYLISIYARLWCRNCVSEWLNIMLVAQMPSVYVSMCLVTARSEAFKMVPW